nr:hypothetical protein [Tanacetum cinerariifolium]
MNTDNTEKLGNMSSYYLDEDNLNKYDWFDKTINAHQDSNDDETLQEGSTIIFTKHLKASLKTDKLTKFDIKNKGERFNMLKKSFTSNIEFEYHLEQVALAMFKEIDWENHESNVHLETPFYVDYTKPLPILVIKKRVKDVQLDVESHQQKLNLRKLNLAFFGINNEEPYNMLQKPFGVVCISGSGGNQFMAYKEIYKFYDTTLKKVSDELSTMMKDHKLGYKQGVEILKNRLLLQTFGITCPWLFLYPLSSIFGGFS